MHFDFHPDTYRPERRGEEKESLITEWRGRLCDNVKGEEEEM